jgi:hypothetical protein
MVSKPSTGADYIDQHQFIGEFLLGDPLRGGRSHISSTDHCDFAHERSPMEEVEDVRLGVDEEKNKKAPRWARGW